MPVGAAMAGARPAPASDIASASRKSDDFNISGSPPSNDPMISLLLVAIGLFLVVQTDGREIQTYV
jgi:hypothetical protein